MVRNPEMAAATTNRFSIRASGALDPLAQDSLSTAHIRRRVPHQSARALRLLGHAIEYVANEFLQDNVPPSSMNPRLQAIRLLMALNREVYSECPEASAEPSFGERCRRLLRSRFE